MVTTCPLQLRFHLSGMGRDEDPKQTSLPITCTCSDLGDCMDLTQSPAGSMGGEAVPVWQRSRAPGHPHLRMVPPFLDCHRGCYHTYLSPDREQKDVCLFLSKQLFALSSSSSLPAPPMPGTCLQCPGNGPAPGWAAP